MKISTIIPDADYQRIVAAGGRRIKGSIAMISPDEFEFRAFSPESPADGLPRRTLRLRHGHATVAPDRVKIYIMVKRKDAPQPVDVIYDETDDAVEFIAANC